MNSRSCSRRLSLQIDYAKTGSRHQSLAHHRERPEAQFHLSQSCLQKHEQGRESTSRSARRQRSKSQRDLLARTVKAGTPKCVKSTTRKTTLRRRPFFSFGSENFLWQIPQSSKPNQRCLCLGYGHRTQSHYSLGLPPKGNGSSGFVEQNSRGCSRFEYSGPGPFGRIGKDSDAPFVKDLGQRPELASPGEQFGSQTQMVP